MFCQPHSEVHSAAGTTGRDKCNVDEGRGKPGVLNQTHGAIQLPASKELDSKVMISPISSMGQAEILNANNHLTLGKFQFESKLGSSGPSPVLWHAQSSCSSPCLGLAVLP